MTENLEPNKGGTLYLQSYKVDTLNPLLTKKSSSMQVMNLMYDSLIRYDSNMNILPWLAESWQVSDDGMTWTLHLKEGVKWHDGKEFTADDVDFTFSTIMNYKTDTVYKTNTQYVSYYKAVDKYTFKVVLDQPYGHFIRMMNFPILPKHQFESVALEDTYESFQPIGTGPYQFVTHTPLKSIELKANNSWWQDKGPYIEQIIVKILPDNQTALYALEAKEVDLVLTNVVDWEKYSSKERLKTKEFTTNYYEFLGVNLNHRVLGNKEVRKAIAQGIDREKIIDEVLLGHAHITDVPMIPNSPLYDNSSQIYNYNRKKAKELLEQAGWKDLNGDGILEKETNGVNMPLAFELTTNNDNIIRTQTAEMIVSQLKDIGMNVTLKEVSWDELQNNINNKKFDIALIGLNLSQNVDLSFALHSKEIERGTNFSSYSNAIIDDLLYKAFMEVDSTKRKEIYSELQKLIVEDLPYISLYIRTSAVVYNDKIKGDISPTNMNIYHNIYKWFIQKENIEE